MFSCQLEKEREREIFGGRMGEGVIEMSFWYNYRVHNKGHYIFREYLVALIRAVEYLGIAVGNILA